MFELTIEQSKSPICRQINEEGVRRYQHYVDVSTVRPLCLLPSLSLSSGSSHTCRAFPLVASQYEYISHSARILTLATQYKRTEGLKVS